MTEEFTDRPARFITVEDATFRVIKTGEFNGCEVTFSDDGREWSVAWLADDDHPAYAKAVVHRKGVEVPATVVVRWAEYFPADNPERAEAWLRMPTVMLAKVARMAGFRQQFGDVLGGYYEAAEFDAKPTDPGRDWRAEADAAGDAAALIKLHSDAREAGALRGPEGDAIGEHIGRRLSEFTTRAEAPQPAETRPAPKPAPPKPRRRR